MSYTHLVPTVCLLHCSPLLLHESPSAPLAPQLAPHNQTQRSPLPSSGDKVLTFLKSPEVQMDNVSSSGNPGECGRGECYSLWYWWRKAQAVLDRAQLARGRMETCHRSTDTSLGLNKVMRRPRSCALLGAPDRSSATNLPHSGSDIWT